ncbi:hypothetical protein HELRODRAFT_192854 [Helobdella robusta]|uniref:C2H2-type domain-containing protein n=1 Tax=Helobdella robusta TaxID=6412 RepID=T1FUD1_HELRO|nr:hypothetical protein HELRODRAFT_192854 [Helobdella robusta]ESN99554.1 hypothetical protein HELRODRAFT_192854 [Helobdella robusta]
MDQDKFLKELEDIKNVYQEHQLSSGDNHDVENDNAICNKLYDALIECLATESKRVKAKLEILTSSLTFYVELRFRQDAIAPEADAFGHFLFMECSRLVLGIEFHHLDNLDPYKVSFKHAIVNVYTRLQEFAIGQVFLILEWLMVNQWSHATLVAMMKGEDIDKEIALNYIRSGEYPELFRLRVEMLMESGCDNFASNLVSWCVLSPLFENDVSLRSTNFLLLYKLNKMTQLQNQCYQLTCCMAKEILKHLAPRVNEDTALLLCLSHNFLLIDWLKPTIYCCTQLLLEMWLSLQRQKEADLEKFLDSVSKLISLYQNVQQLNIALEVIVHLFDTQFIQFCSELAIKSIQKHQQLQQQQLDNDGLTSSNSTSSSSMQSNSQAAVLQEIVAGMAHTCKTITKLYRDHPQVYLSSLMSILYLQPTEENYLNLDTAFRTTPFIPTTTPFDFSTIFPAILDVNPNTFALLVECINSLRPAALNFNLGWGVLSKMFVSFVEQSEFPDDLNANNSNDIDINANNVNRNVSNDASNCSQININHDISGGSTLVNDMDVITSALHGADVNINAIMRGSDRVGNEFEDGTEDVLGSTGIGISRYTYCGDEFALSSSLSKADDVDGNTYMLSLHPYQNADINSTSSSSSGQLLSNSNNEDINNIIPNHNNHSIILGSINSGNIILNSSSNNNNNNHDLICDTVNDKEQSDNNDLFLQQQHHHPQQHDEYHYHLQQQQQQQHLLLDGSLFPQDAVITMAIGGKNVLNNITLDDIQQVLNGPIMSGSNAGKEVPMDENALQEITAFLQSEMGRSGSSNSSSNVFSYSLQQSTQQQLMMMDGDYMRVTSPLFGDDDNEDEAGDDDDDQQQCCDNDDDNGASGDLSIERSYPPPSYYASLQNKFNSTLGVNILDSSVDNCGDNDAGDDDDDVVDDDDDNDVNRLVVSGTILSSLHHTSFSPSPTLSFIDQSSKQSLSSSLPSLSQYGPAYMFVSSSSLLQTVSTSLSTSSPSTTSSSSSSSLSTSGANILVTDSNLPYLKQLLPHLQTVMQSVQTMALCSSHSASSHNNHYVNSNSTAASNASPATSAATLQQPQQPQIMQQHFQLLRQKQPSVCDKSPSYSSCSSLSSSSTIYPSPMMIGEEIISPPPQQQSDEDNDTITNNANISSARPQQPHCHIAITEPLNDLKSTTTSTIFTHVSMPLTTVSAMTTTKPETSLTSNQSSTAPLNLPFQPSKQLKCDECGKEFISKAGRTTHMLRVHKKNNNTSAITTATTTAVATNTSALAVGSASSDPLMTAYSNGSNSDSNVTDVNSSTSVNAFISLPSPSLSTQQAHISAVSLTPYDENCNTVNASNNNNNNSNNSATIHRDILDQNSEISNENNADDSKVFGVSCISNSSNKDHGMDDLKSCFVKITRLGRESPTFDKAGDSADNSMEDQQHQHYQLQLQRQHFMQHLQHRLQPQQQLQQNQHPTSILDHDDNSTDQFHKQQITSVQQLHQLQHNHQLQQEQQQQQSQYLSCMCESCGEILEYNDQLASHKCYLNLPQSSLVSLSSPFVSSSLSSSSNTQSPLSYESFLDGNKLNNITPNNYAITNNINNNNDNVNNNNDDNKSSNILEADKIYRLDTSRLGGSSSITPQQKLLLLVTSQQSVNVANNNLINSNNGNFLINNNTNIDSDLTAQSKIQALLRTMKLPTTSKTQILFNPSSFSAPLPSAPLSLPSTPTTLMTQQMLINAVSTASTMLPLKNNVLAALPIQLQRLLQHRVQQLQLQQLCRLQQQQQKQQLTLTLQQQNGHPQQFQQNIGATKLNPANNNTQAPVLEMLKLAEHFLKNNNLKLVPQQQQQFQLQQQQQQQQFQLQQQQQFYNKSLLNMNVAKGNQPLTVTSQPNISNLNIPLNNSNATLQNQVIN